MAAVVLGVGAGWADVLEVVNGAGLIAALGIVMIAGMATLLFRRW
jgi:hypothetical protein